MYHVSATFPPSLSPHLTHVLYSLTQTQRRTQSPPPPLPFPFSLTHTQRKKKEDKKEAPIIQRLRNAEAIDNMCFVYVCMYVCMYVFISIRGNKDIVQRLRNAGGKKT